MKRLVSLAVVVAFFVAIPQCLGQSQDAEKDATLLLTEQQLVQMFHLAMAPPTIASVPVSNLLLPPGCIKCCGDERKMAIEACLQTANSRADEKSCRTRARDSYRSCSDGCHNAGSCNFPPI